MVFGRKRRDDETSGGAAGTEAASTLQEENSQLKRAVAQLSLLNELAQAMGVSDSSDEMIKVIVHHTKRTLAAEQVMIYFIERSSGVDLYRTKVRDATVNVRHEFHFNEALGALMEITRAPFRSDDPHHDPHLRGVALDADLRSLLCVPLLVRGGLTGLVAACNKQGAAGFDEDDLRMLTIMANQSAQILETTRLREEEAAYERLHRDVQLARDIQAGLLPESAPRIEGYDIAGVSRAAELVGGDYFDYIELGDGRLALCLGDVSGKGVPASLLMANLQATLRGQSRTCPSAGDCLTWANRLLYRSTSPDKFATLFYCILDPRTHEITYSNAGHERPLLVTRAGTAAGLAELDSGGPVLGVLDDFPYTEGRCDLAPGDMLLVYSDGLTDTVNAADEPFGVPGVEKVLRGLAGADSQQVVDRLVAAVNGHAGEVPAFDDVTLIVIRRLPVAEGRGT